ncbi:MAG: thioredoxin domain-containing protein [Bacteroidota bacterium]
MTLDPPLSADDHLGGPDDAPVTIVHYGDFECPYSKDVHDLVEEIRDTHPMGIRFAFRHFPLRPHPNALAAAIAAEAAARQGGFWTYRDRLYDHQLQLRPDQLVGHAEAVGLDGGAVKEALDTEAGKAEILARKKQAVASGVGSTLGLWIDDVWYEEDALEEAVIQKVIYPLREAGP